MATNTKEAPKPEIVSAREAERLDHVDPNGVYTATLQLGSNRRWRQFSGGAWKELGRDNRGRDGAENRQMQMVPALHQIGPYSGMLLNGLISAHNAWVEANDEQSGPEGTVNRMLIITGIEDSDGPARDDENTRRGGAGSSQEKMIARIVSQTVTEILTALGATPKGARSTGSK